MIHDIYYVNLKPDVRNHTQFTKHYDRLCIYLTTIQQLESDIVNKVLYIYNYITGILYVVGSWVYFGKIFVSQIII